MSNKIIADNKFIFSLYHHSRAEVWFLNVSPQMYHIPLTSALPRCWQHGLTVLSPPAGLWTVFTLGGVGSKAAASPELSSPLANQSLLLLLVLANLTDAPDAPNPYRQAILSFKNTQGWWHFFFAYSS